MIDDSDEDSIEHIYRRRSPRSSFDTILYLYSIVGVLIAIFAFGYLGLTFLQIELTYEQLMAVVAGGVGLVLAVLSRTMMRLKKIREFEELQRFNEFEMAVELLGAWSRFEQASKQFLNSKHKNFSRHSLRSILSRLANEGKVNANEMKILEEALEARNRIAHGGGGVSFDFLVKATESVQEITKRIEGSADDSRT